MLFFLFRCGFFSHSSTHSSFFSLSLFFSFSSLVDRRKWWSLLCSLRTIVNSITSWIFILYLPASSSSLFLCFLRSIEPLHSCFSLLDGFSIVSEEKDCRLIRSNRFSFEHKQMSSDAYLLPFLLTSLMGDGDKLCVYMLTFFFVWQIWLCLIRCVDQ